jgi:hypothetical protein
MPIAGQPIVQLLVEHLTQKALGNTLEEEDLITIRKFIKILRITPLKLRLHSTIQEDQEL